jgi:DNA modification methylase
MTARILIGDVRAALRQVPSASVHCCVTSPPYWGLRDYGTAGQLGLEATPEEYVENMVAVFREVRRVLRPDGTLWLNLGDSYCSSTQSNHGRGKATPAANRRGEAQVAGEWENPPRRPVPIGLKPKDLVGIPWMVAFALRADGWYLRQEIIWHKPNPMPESVRDRPTKSHEYLFLLTKSAQYFYDADAIREVACYGDHPRNGTPDMDDIQAPGQPRQSGLTQLRRHGSKRAGKNSHANVDRDPAHGSRKQDASEAAGETDHGTRNSRSVWTIATHPFPEAHFATFPPELAERCILAGTSAMGCCPFCAAPRAPRTVDRQFQPQDDVAVDLVERGAGDQKPMDESNGWEGVPRGTVDPVTTGWAPTCDCPPPPEGAALPGCTVLDPFSGAGTAGMVALRCQRQYLGIDLYDKYIEMSVRRIVADAPLLNRVVVERVAAPSEPPDLACVPSPVLERGLPIGNDVWHQRPERSKTADAAHHIPGLPPEHKMTKREAKRWACYQASAILEGHLDSDSQFEVSDECDLDAVRAGVEQLVNELWRRSGR